MEQRPTFKKPAYAAPREEFSSEFGKHQEERKLQGRKYAGPREYREAVKQVCRETLGEE